MNYRISTSRILFLLFFVFALCENTNAQRRLYDIHFPSPDSGFAIVNNRVFRTTDAGANWELYTIRQNQFDFWLSLKSVYFPQQDIGYVGGTRYTSLGGTTSKIYKTTNRGESWREQLSDGPGELNSVYFLNSDTGWAVGWGDWSVDNAIVFHTSDGETWATQAIIPSTGSLTSIRFIDSNTGWAAGKKSSSIGFIVKTTDGGNNWDIQAIDTIPPLNDIFPLNQDTCLAAGTSSTILLTFDGGLSWQRQTLGLLYTFNALFFIDENTGWAVGSRFIAKTTNGGLAWQQQLIDTTQSFTSVFFVDEMIGWTTSSQGKISKTTDGGNNWMVVYQIGPPDISVTQLSVNFGEVLIDTGKTDTVAIYNEGQSDLIVSQTTKITGSNADNFHKLGIYVRPNFYPSSFPKPVYISPGEIGKLAMKFTPLSIGEKNAQLEINSNDPDENPYIVLLEGTGIDSTEIDTSYAFELFQNSPNPSIGLARIRYSVPKNSNVTLKIYDITGRLVKTLMNDVQSGEQIVVWDGKNQYGQPVSSGIYIYSLTVEDKTINKKMIFLR